MADSIDQKRRPGTIDFANMTVTMATLVVVMGVVWKASAHFSVVEGHTSEIQKIETIQKDTNEKVSDIQRKVDRLTPPSYTRPYREPLYENND